MYLSHFGLNQAPFGITPNPAFFYSGNNRGDILEALLYAILHGEGIIKVTGEVGSGKTMLCRMLETLLPLDVDVIYLITPTLNPKEVAYSLATELDIITEGKRVEEIVRQLQIDLITKHVSGRRVVLLVEEAQAMPLATLEEIRLYSNLETAHNKLLQIVLFGQPELETNLALPQMRQLKERITQSFNVPPLTLELIPDFLMFRMRAAGYHGPNIFSKSAVKLLSKVSQGVVRRISILADKSLLAAFADNAHSVTSAHVRAAVRDSEFSKTTRRSTVRNIMFGLTAACVTLAAVGFGWKYFLLDAQELKPTARTARHQQMPPTTHIVLAQTETEAEAEAATTTSTTLSAAPVSSPVPAPTKATHLSVPVKKPTIAPIAVPSAVVTSVVTPVVTSHTTTVPAVKPKEAAVVVATPVPQIKKVTPPPSTVVAEASSASAASIVSPKAAPSSTPAVSTGKTLEELLVVSKAWVNQETATRRTVQITFMVAEKHTQIEQFLRKAQTELGTNRLHLYPSRVGGTPRFGVLYGSFATLEEANAAIKELTEKWGYRPQLRSLGRIRDEIARSQSVDMWPQ